MRVTDKKFECIESWVGMIIPGKSVNENKTLLELIDIIDDSNLSDTTPPDEMERVILLALSTFYAADIADILSPTKTEENVYSAYGRCCLLLLVLAMGLRLKCKIFMSAALKLPSAMHYSVVEMTQPLIDASSVSLVSFIGLDMDSENQPLTPIVREDVMRAPPFTCPAGASCATDERFASKLRCLSPISDRLCCATAVTSPSLPFALKSQKAIRGRYPTFVPLELESELMDSPLYSLKQILDSPNLISKSQYLAKMEELRHLSAQLAEMQHLLDENNMDMQRLTSSYHTLELDYKELEVRLKRRETEISELRDELVFEREARCNQEKALQNAEGLRERLAFALKELKSLSSVSAENRELHEEVTRLRNQVKTLQNLRPRLMNQQVMQQQLANMKEQVRVADEKLLQLIRAREDSLVSSQHQRFVSHTQTSQQPAHDSFEFTTENPSSCPVLKLNFSPDSSQPELGGDVDGGTASPEVYGESIPSPILPPSFADSPAFTPESLACVVAANSQMQLLEASLSTAKEDLQRARHQSIRWQCQAIVARAVSSHRLNKLMTLHAVLEDVNRTAASCEMSYREKLNGMNSQVSSMESRLKEAESAVRAFERKYAETLSTLSTREQDLLRKLQDTEDDAKRTACQLTTELEERIKAEQAKDEEITRMRAQLVGLESDIERKLESVEHDVNEQRRALEAEIVGLRDSLQREKHTCERLTTQLNDQLKANSAYRKASETELDHLRNILSAASSEKAAYMLECNQKCESMQSRLGAELRVLKDSHDAISRQAALLKLSLEESDNKLKSQKEEMETLSSVSALQQHELAQLRSQYEESHGECLQLERKLTTVQAEAEQRGQKCSELESRLRVVESEKRSLEKQCASLTDRCASLEAEAMLHLDRVKQYQHMIDAAQQDRTEWERVAAVLRDQVRQVRSDWVHCQTQLDQTQSHLVQTKQSLYEAKLQLQEAEFNQTKASERLAFLESRPRRVESRLVRSNISLYTASRPLDDTNDSESRFPGPNVRTTELTPDQSSTQSPLLAPLSVDQNTSFTFVSPLPVSHGTDHSAIERPPPRPPALHLPPAEVRDAAVQKCGSHSVLKRAYIPCSDVDCAKRHNWPPCDYSTAPISPQSLRSGAVISGNTPLLHSKRFARFLRRPEDEPRGSVSGELYNKPVPKPSEPYREFSGDKSSESHVSSTVHVESSQSNNKLLYSHSVCTSRGTYIPETPLPWNALSASSCVQLRSMSAADVVNPSLTDELTDPKNVSDISGPSVASEHLYPADSSVRQAVVSTGSAVSKKHTKFWYLKKLRKRSKHNPSLSSSPDFVFTDATKDRGLQHNGD